jgi:nucleoside-diphosphate-sugar epimerase
MKVKDCIAVVTGGASGLGEATVRNLASGGGRVTKLHSLFIATIEPIRPGKKYPRKHSVQKRGFFPCYKSIR